MHSRLFVRIVVGVGLLGALGAMGCTENPVGRKCFIGADAGNDTQAIIASPALECPSRTCLHFPKDEGATPPPIPVRRTRSVGFKTAREKTAR
jgi:hypothetical protein